MNSAINCSPYSSRTVLLLVLANKCAGSVKRMNCHDLWILNPATDRQLHRFNAIYCNHCSRISVTVCYQIRPAWCAITCNSTHCVFASSIVDDVYRKLRDQEFSSMNVRNSLKPKSFITENFLKAVESLQV